MAPTRAMESGHFAQRNMSLGNGDTGNLRSGFCRRKVIEHENERHRIVGDRGVPALRNSNINGGADRGVPEILAAVAIGNQRSSFWIATGHLRHERLREPVRRVGPLDCEPPGLTHLARADTKSGDVRDL